MKKTITLNDLILFAYNETELLDTVLVEQTIEANLKVKRTYEKILSTISSLNELLLVPSDKTMDTIIQYSRTSVCSEL